MPSDDLSSIPDLQDKYRRVLTGKLKITTFHALAHADRQAIYRAMRESHVRPTHQQIAKWQDHARSRLKEATTDRSDWHPAVSFAVVFAQRQVGDSWEHRIEAERTEVEPEQEPRIWLGWGCGGICAWMREQVPGAAAREAGAEAEAKAVGPAEPAATPAHPAEQAATSGGPAEPIAAPGGAGRERAELQIEQVTVIGLDTSPMVVAADAAAATMTGPPGPPRIEISVSGGRRGQEIHAAARVLREREFGWNLQEPVVIKGATGVASFDLSPLPAGRHDLVLVAWAPDGTATLAREELRDLTIPPPRPG